MCSTILKLQILYARFNKLSTIRIAKGNNDYQQTVSLFCLVEAICLPSLPLWLTSRRITWPLLEMMTWLKWTSPMTAMNHHWLRIYNKYDELACSILSNLPLVVFCYYRGWKLKIIPQHHLQRRVLNVSKIQPSGFSDIRWGK